jgi:hypothetical protein
VGVGLAVVTATLAMTPVANAAPVPANLVPPNGNQMFLVGHVLKDAGVQIYKCTSITAPDGTVKSGWAFVAPRATLTGDNGQVIATHFAGPTWQATDGSKVTAKAIAKDPPADPLTAGATNIQQLLLQVTSPPTEDEGRLSATTYIQRLNTTGGVQPASCDPKKDTNQLEVPYTADYVFWKATGKP